MTEDQEGEGFEWVVDSEVVQNRRTLGGNAGVDSLPRQVEAPMAILRWRLQMASEAQWSKEYMCV